MIHDGDGGGEKWFLSAGAKESFVRDIEFLVPCCLIINESEKDMDRDRMFDDALTNEKQNKDWLYLV